MYVIIAKSKNYTYTVLGKNKFHLNITGIKSFLDVEPLITSLTIISNLDLGNFKNFTIYNIYSTYKTHSGLKEVLLKNKDSNFRIFNPAQFGGIIIYYSKYSLTYFNSGAVILVGLENIHELKLCTSKYKPFLTTVKIPKMLNKYCLKSVVKNDLIRSVDVYSCQLCHHASNEIV